MASEFFSCLLSKSDSEIWHAVEGELNRQRTTISLIASENIASSAVLEAQGTLFTNKYAEGYPGHRYYDGCHYVDIVESLAIDRAKKLFSCNFANVQPHSGSQANQAVYFALLKPNDVILGLSLDCGGHLTHGSKVNQSGKWFNAINYKVQRENGLIDYEEVRSLAHKHKPKLIIAGCSAYPRYIDFAQFKNIATEVGAYLLVDMAHFAGLVAANIYDNPLKYADVVTTTTHKTLRGPRGGMILMNDPDIAKAVGSALFPGMQGGPLMHVIAAKAVALKEAMTPNYTQYMKNVVANAQLMSSILIERGYTILTGGTDTHLLIVDLRPNNLKGNIVSSVLAEIGLICNKNAIPFDITKPSITSGIRLGTPSGTSRGFGTQEFTVISHMIADILDDMQQKQYGEKEMSSEFWKKNSDLYTKTQQRVQTLCANFPVY